VSLEYAVLGWLSTGPGSGYDLVRQLGQGLNWFWSAPHSQIYPCLKGLEARGLITSRSEVVGTKLEKRVYEITDAGRTAVRTWTEQPPTYPPNRDVERLKLIFGDHGNIAAIRRHLETHRAHFAERVDDLQRFVDVLRRREHARIESRIAAAPTEALQELTRALRELAWDGEISRAEGEISWADSALRWLDLFEERHGDIEPAPGPDSGAPSPSPAPQPGTEPAQT
jgi:PadR family transcriptional regulator AphA